MLEQKAPQAAGTKSSSLPSADLQSEAPYTCDPEAQPQQNSTVDPAKLPSLWGLAARCGKSPRASPPKEGAVLLALEARSTWSSSNRFKSYDT